MDVNNNKLVTIKIKKKVSSYNGRPRGNGNNKFCTVLCFRFADDRESG